MLAIDTMGSVLCIAPHPDDEVFGCGGLLTLLQSSGCVVSTLIITSGEAGGAATDPALAQLRQQESLQAAKILGLAPPQFLAMPDRGLVYASPLIERIEQALHTHRPHYLLLPALSEPHPDHQALALAGLAAAQRVPSTQTLLFYEVGAPTLPNCFVDITRVATRKWDAIQAFASQLSVQGYDRHARAFAALRSFGLAKDCTEAEAYFRVDLASLRERGAAAAIPFWPLKRQHQQLANAPEQLPLVSVLVRSMDRAHLSDAVASVAAQTYPNLELVVVNASGHPHSPVLAPLHRLRVHMVNPVAPEGGSPPACSRSQAANLALTAAAGELAIFLDDDDLMAANHIERLVAALQTAPSAVAAYGGVRVEGPDAAFIRNYDLPWSRHRLHAINFLPIHAVLFRMAVVKSSKIAFDTELPVLEDWDFWRNLCRYGDMLHCSGVSCTYRQGYGDSGLGQRGHANYWKNWHKNLLDRHVSQAPQHELSETLAWHAIELDRVQSANESHAIQLDDERQTHAIQLDDERQTHAALQAQLETLAQLQQALQQQLDDERQIHAALQAQLQQALQDKQGLIQSLTEQIGHTQAQLLNAQGQVRNLHASLSWRLTAPLRRLKRLFGR